jgi:TolA-binding protein
VIAHCPGPIELSRAALANGIDDQLQAHLDSCARCTAALASHANVADEARLLPIVAPSPDHARLVRAALMTAARAPAVAAAPRRLRLFGVGAATALAAAAILFVVIRRPASSTQVAYRGAIHAHDGAQFARVGGVPDEIVRLTRGTITVEVSPLHAGERFRVITADSEVEVRGTAFDVTAEDDKLAAVRVLHGKVEVRASGAAPKLLAAGERWEMKLATTELDDEKLVAAAASKVEPNTGDSASQHADARADATGSARAHIARDASRGDASRDMPGDTARAAARADVTRDASRTKPGDTARADTARTDKPGRTVAPDKPAIATDASKSPLASTQGAPKRPIEILFEQGWAALAAGNPRDAATSFERAATSAPNDPLAEDAWFWRASALARAKSSAATGALEQFLARYPRSNRAGEASAVLGWIVIATDLDRAENLFTMAATDRVPAVRASAEKGLAAVAKQRGK